MQAKQLIGLIIFLHVSAVTGCHHGGSEPGPTTVVSGMASKGPINGGTVNVFAIQGGVEDRSAPIGQGVTDDNGNYTIDLGAYTGPVLVEVTGGSFIDEISGASVTLKTPMRAMFSNTVTGTQTTAVTPLTELAYKKASGAGALSAASIDDANAKMASFFGLSDIISTLPIAGGAGDDQKKYAAVVASFSQYITNEKNQGESLDDALSRLLTQMGDEVKNTGGFSIGTINDINTAIIDFTNSGKNTTGAAIPPLPPHVSGLLKLSTTGTAVIGAIDVTVNFPVGVKVLADATGEASAGVVTFSVAAAAGDSLSTAKFTPASSGSPAQLHIALINVTGFGTGEFATIKFDLDAGGSFPTGTPAFSLAGFTVTGTNGSPISGVTALPSSVAAEIK